MTGQLVVFDIGGTHFRKGLYTFPSDIVNIEVEKALNYIDNPHLSISELQNGLIEYLLKNVHKFSSSKGLKISAASISLGAAIDHNTGLVLDSGPLWGPKCKSFDILGKLRERDSSIKWSILNDVTAALLRYRENAIKNKFRKIALMVVSTGIAMRTLIVDENRVPVDRICGLQGEIGHLPMTVLWKGHNLKLICDCGGNNHLNAYSSGRGLNSLWSLLSENNPLPFNVAIKERNKKALEVLQISIKPIADAIRWLFTIDPEVDQLILTGGVVHGLGAIWLKALHKELDHSGIYQISKKNKKFFREKIVVGSNDDLSGMIGAGIWFSLRSKLHF